MLTLQPFLIAYICLEYKRYEKMVKEAEDSDALVEDNDALVEVDGGNVDTLAQKEEGGDGEDGLIDKGRHYMIFFLFRNWNRQVRRRLSIIELRNILWESEEPNLCLDLSSWSRQN